MRIIDKEVLCKGRSDVFEFHPLGDSHIGAPNCAETRLRRRVSGIAANPNAYAILGGDVTDAIKPQDMKRFDVNCLADWIIEGDADSTREKLGDILHQQFERAADIFEPIKDRILGAIEGNHEHAIFKYHNQNIHRALCQRLGIPDLTDEAFIRLRFKRCSAVVVVKMYIRHGYGGGRTPGTEPNKLDRMLAEWEDADICFTGHTHTADVLPPKPKLYVPNTGKLPKEFLCRYRWAANWGCWLYSHSSGASTYASRACYPARPMISCKAEIRPFKEKRLGQYKYANPEIEIRTIPL